MEIKKVDSNKLKSKFVDFVYEVYKDDNNFIDGFNFNVKTFLYKKDSFAKSCIVTPIMVVENNKILARCMYIYNQKLPALQISFFEALPKQDQAVDLIIKNAEKTANELKLNRIIIGVNGHISYGVGFLLDNYNTPNPFDGIYSKHYYIDYFRKYNFHENTLSTYYMKVHKPIDNQKIINNIYSKFCFRHINLKDFKNEMNILGRLFNECLKDTYLCFEKEIIESYEIMKDLVPILKNENIIYAIKDGKEIGFVFWHPNYNELLHGGKRNNIFKFLCKFLISKNKADEMKINAIGILPEYWGTGAILGLFNEVYKAAKNKYIGGESSFVWDSNINSALICKRLSEREYRHYVIFESSSF